MTGNRSGSMGRVRFIAGAIVVVAAAAAGALAGHRAGARSVPPSPLAQADAGGAVVARSDGRTVTAGELERLIAAQPAPIRERLAADAAERKAFVEGHVRMLALAHRAEAKGYQRDPEFVRGYAQELATRLIQKDFEEPERATPPTEAELRAWFDAHAAELQRPERVRLALVSFDVTDAAARDRKRAAANAALAEARRGSADHYAFGTLARLRSEDPRTRGTNGELPPMGRDDLAAAFGPELAEAAFELSTPGAILPRVVEGERALHVVKLVAREPEDRPAFEEVKDVLRQRVAAERRGKRFTEFMGGVVKDAGVTIDEQQVAGLKVAGGAAR